MEECSARRHRRLILQPSRGPASASPLYTPPQHQSGIMEPLTIASAVVGLIAAASRIGPLLYHFVTHTKDAPRSASQTHDEINSVTAALERLQSYLLGTSTTSIERRSLITLRNIVATLTACVTTYSDLERVVGRCVDEEGKFKRIKWLFNESDIAEVLQRLQGHKSSLTLMLTILQWYVYRSPCDHRRRN